MISNPLDLKLVATGHRVYSMANNSIKAIETIAIGWWF